jgi:hypothetical protein
MTRVSNLSKNDNKVLPNRMYNICVIQPPDYIHFHAFDEVVDLMKFAISELGIACSVTANQVLQDRVNIIVGSHLIPAAEAVEFPSATIILNTEPLFSQQNIGWSERVVDFARVHKVWDYNARNIESLNARGISNARLMRIGYQPELERIRKAPQQDIDVLFYGSYNERRQLILAQLRERGLNVATLFGVYGEERDAFVSRAKVVLNMHYYDQHVFEIVRVFYLLTNSKAVVAEVGENTSVEERLRAGLECVPYGGLVEACEWLANDAVAREQLEISALRTIKAWPQADFMRQLIG